MAYIIILFVQFYLAFENSHCQDYITEKFWRALDKGIVPIVMGNIYILLGILTFL